MCGKYVVPTSVNVLNNQWGTKASQLYRIFGKRIGLTSVINPAIHRGDRCVSHPSPTVSTVSHSGARRGKPLKRFREKRERCGIPAMNRGVND